MNAIEEFYNNLECIEKTAESIHKISQKTSREMNNQICFDLREESNKLIGSISIIKKLKITLMKEAIENNK